ncbi:hypothetical protein Acr_18g0000060 [Actinidia rufa]|uniref:Uncharacterized protein n=1 Tax=Actinidia rufa TaxID=165716 RepID=A0A7J0G4Y6_9ERIC|nr:hypothetical protein Acr_18g0000060 [Actinidia rufa]
MIRPRTKHASNDPRGEDTNPVEPDMEFQPWGISIDSTEGEEEEGGEKETSHHAIETEGYSSAQQFQLQWQEEDPIREEHPMQEEHPMHERHPVHEGPSSQEGPPGRFLKYFGKLNATMEQMEQR